VGDTVDIVEIIEQSFYDRVGGLGFFERLVGSFYEGVEADPLLRPLYPEEDLSAARHRLALFFAQYWGGPTLYEQLRGHPRLRMRHVDYVITKKVRNAWLGHMRSAMDREAKHLSEKDRKEMLEYLEMAANGLRNR
jgi:hemoglobin